jgi:hypothetical protein
LSFLTHRAHCGATGVVHLHMKGDGSIDLPRPPERDRKHGISNVCDLHVTPARGGFLPGRGLQSWDRENPIGKVEQTMGGQWFHGRHAWRIC